MSSAFEFNLHILNERHSPAARVLAQADDSAPAVEVFRSRAGSPTCKVILPSGESHLLHSAFNPEDAETMLSSPLGNHHLVVAGDWEKRIDKFTSLFIRTGA